MSMVFNSKAVRAEMKDQDVTTTKLNSFFDGALRQLTSEQLDDVIEILDNNLSKVKEHVTNCKIALSGQEIID